MEIESLYKIFLESKGVSTDSRTLREGQLFFALKGENFDGNTYIKKALELGATYAVSDDTEIASKDKQILLVPSVLHALQDLATLHRNKLATTLIAITGTNGKTTTKELLYETLTSKYRVQKTQGNLNNHIGVPLTLLQLKEETEFGIIEMGANKRYDIQELCNIAEPDFGIITNIGQAHLEGFENLDGIKATKGEMYDYLFEQNGIAFVNAKDPVLIDMLPAGIETILYNTLEYSANKGSEGLLQIAFQDQAGKHQTDTQLFGEYNLQNIIAAIDIARYFGVELESTLKSISTYQPSLLRSQVSKIKNASFYIDAYNANPSSMRAGIENFTALEGVKTMILGDMKELGKRELDFHKSILDEIPTDFEGELILIGPLFKQIESPMLADKYDTVEQFLSLYDLQRFQGKKVFLKASRSIGLERVASSFEQL